MTLIHLTPGTGGMYCGSCLRDQALVTALRKRGHNALLVPLYLPLTLETTEPAADAPIFFSGVNVYLEQKLPWFRSAPRWLHDWLASPKVLKWAAGKAAKTRPEDVGDLTLSMLRGEEGHQARELDELIGWLQRSARPDVICLSNSMLVGLVRQLKRELRVPVVCSLQGEDGFLDALPERFRAACWRTLAERSHEVDRFVAPSRYYADLMARRLGQPRDRVQVVHNGIDLTGYEPAPDPPDPPVLGYFARLCREKGLDTLVEAFIALRRRGQVKKLKLRVGGTCTPADKPLVQALRERLKAQGLLGEVEFHPNLDRAAKLAFLRSLSVLTVPALYGEAFGLYVIEALASGVPVVQPRHAAFPELLEATGGGALYEPGDSPGLVKQLEDLLLNPIQARGLGVAGRKAVLEKFTVESMAHEMVQVVQGVR
jgi:glycosyltransferase involved in cell wall biosynthesis